MGRSSCILLELVERPDDCLHKYLRLQITMYNAVGDIIRSSIGQATTRGINYTGPLTADEGEEKVTWGPVWYNATAACIKIQSISVEFMNGKVSNFAGVGVQRALGEGVKNDCRASVR